MAQLIIAGAPRNGAGLIHELLLQDGKFVSGALSLRGTLKALTLGEKSWLDLGGNDAKAAGSGNPTEGAKVLVDYSPHFAALLPEIDAALASPKYVFVVRRPVDAIQSLMRAWESKTFEHWVQPKGWWGLPWSFSLIADADQLIGKPIAEVVSQQYLQLSEQVRIFSDGLDKSRFLFVAFEDLLENPNGILAEITTFAGSQFSTKLSEPLPRSSRSISQSGISKDGPLRFEIEAALRIRQELFTAVRENWLAICKVAETLDAKIAEPIQTRTVAPSQGTPFSSVYTDSLVSLLAQLGATLAISTYKSGHVILSSELEGKLNTTFQRFNRPMGLASLGPKLAIGTLDSIRSYDNQPGLSKSIKPKTFFDAVYAPRNTIYTGDIAIHEMAYGWNGTKDELWFVNTSFSCLCRTDPDYSFVPVWRPKWVSSLANEDRCHLNGLAMVDSKPKYVTALSQTDTAFGWRELKGSSGVIIDITNDEVVSTGLAMPHSPRWHNGALWVLESGKGSLVKVDIETGHRETVAVLPGFTRGLVLIGAYALVGLSQVRESVFKDLPVTETKEERNCGVWIVDTRTGEVSGMLKFDGVVTEIFDLTLLGTGRRANIVESSPDTLHSYTLPLEALSQLAAPTARAAT
jgi:uncharacterized protein (TIGR03032 family)